MTSTSRPPSDPVDVEATADPVAAVLEAHAAGRRISLRTSGSTGQPRAVVRTTPSWFDSFPHVATLTGLSTKSRMWLPGPMSATMNLFAATLTRHLGATVVSALEDATHAHLTPLQLLGLVERRAPLDGTHLTVAGDRLSASLRDTAVEAGAVVDHYYGAAELSFVGWGSHEGDLSPFPGVQVEARADELWARSPYLCEGYDGAPGALRTDVQGFATVGDLGSLEDGILMVWGRGTDRVITGAATILVADVEAVLHGATTGEVVVVGVPHGTLGEVVAAVLTEPGDLDRARVAAGARLSPAARPRIWFHVDGLPLNAAGKVDRDELVRTVTATEAVRLTTTGAR